jgi:hypothetical protein
MSDMYGFTRQEDETATSCGLWPTLLSLELALVHYNLNHRGPKQRIGHGQSIFYASYDLSPQEAMETCDMRTGLLSDISASADVVGPNTRPGYFGL